MAREADHAAVLAVHAAAQAGRHAHAAELAAAALSRGLEHPLLLNVTALHLEQQGLLDEAERLLRRAVEVAPRDPASRNALGLLLLRLERAAESHEQFVALLGLDPSLPFAHVNLGNASLALGELADAEAGFRRALALDPHHAVALARLAHLAVSRGSYPEARVLAEKALARMPGYPDAVLSLAAVELRERNALRAESLIRGLLADPRIEPLERAYGNGLLGDILDAADRAAEAFTAYTTCNEELRRIHAPRFGPGENALQYVQSMQRYFERTPPSTWLAAAPAASARSAARGHVFVLGFPRSGTTLLEVILEGHPEVVSLEEKESLIDGVLEFMRDPDDLDRLARAAPERLAALRRAYWRHVAARGIEVAGKVFVDKYPLNSLKLPLIARLFPEAKILFAGRDPRDVVLSCFRHRFQMSAPLYELLSLEGAARYYDAVMRLVVRLSAYLAQDTCLVRHEDVVTEFAREMKRICAFLNLEWSPAMGDFALRARSRGVLTPSTAQLVRGLNTEGIGQWRRYREQMEPVLPLLDSWVQRFHYEP